ncbi:hypothetical protein Leryth_026458 [Lithospermum erythrorhizon]|nr:hypothetical protein Leryth_026458 [Lithospermum erythrorhizon]
MFVLRRRFKMTRGELQKIEQRKSSHLHQAKNMIVHIDNNNGDLIEDNDESEWLTCHNLSKVHENDKHHLSKGSIKIIDKVLKLFGNASGFHPNLNKSTCYFAGVKPGEELKLSSILRMFMLEELIPFYYARCDNCVSRSFRVRLNMINGT